MAELNHSKSSKTRIDMTAMVDVAFLLLTFFILTTTLATPGSLEVNKPSSEGITEVPCNNTLTLYAGADDKVHCVLGCDTPPITTDFSADGIRRVIAEALAANPKLIISIKPTEHSYFRNLVDLLDEMEITNAPRFALAHVTDEDKIFLADNRLK